MNHLKIYNTIIQKAKSENRIKLHKNHDDFIYYENHHILPKCIGGDNNKENLVLLVPKEHFMCHKLLTYIYYENIKLVYAFHWMCYTKNSNHDRTYTVTARDYAYLRELYVLRAVSDETKIKIGNAHRGKHLTEDHKKKLSRIKSVEEIQKIIQTRKDRECGKGEKNSMYGKGYLISGDKNGRYHKKHSEESIFKMQISAKNRDKINYQTEEYRNKQSKNSSGKNNGMFNKCAYDIWVEKYGKIEADKRNNIKKQKLRKAKKPAKTEQAKENMRIGALNRQKYECEHCGKTFDAGNLKQHQMRIKTLQIKEKLEQCPRDGIEMNAYLDK